MTLQDPDMLIERFLAGTLNHAERQAFCQLLDTDADFLARYIEAANLDAMLRWHHGSVSVAPLEIPAHSVHRPAPRSRPVSQERSPYCLKRLGLAAAIVVAVGGLIALMLSQTGTPATPHATRPVELYASIVDVRNAVFEKSDVATRPGVRVSGGFIRLVSGQIDIEFLSGAKVTVTGPAVFGINSAMRGFVEYGHIAVHCPESAHGFTIGAPGMAIVDLGTRFELAVDDQHQTEVRVIEGLVRLDRLDAQGQTVDSTRLRTSQTARLDSSQQLIVEEPASEMVYSDALDGPADVPLDGRRPAIKPMARAQWMAMGWMADGQRVPVEGVAFSHASLPFSPEPGFVYRFAATLDTTAGDADWLAMGFVGETSLTEFHGLGFPAYWIFLRSTRGESALVTSYNHPPEGTQTGHFVPEGSVDIEVHLDTTADTWTVTWLARGQVLRGPEVVEQNINHIAFSAYNSAAGTIRNVQLERLRPSAAKRDLAGRSHRMTPHDQPTPSYHTNHEPQNENPLATEPQGAFPWNTRRQADL